jgi:hypothetical protein
LAGKSEACQRRAHHGAEADQRRGGVGAVVGKRWPGPVPAARMRPPMALPREYPTLRTT